MSEEPNHWEGVYRSKEEAETSWFEDRPQVSLDLIAETGAGKDAAIVDVGAGSSRLVDCLLDQGFRRITVLDLSETALRTARARLSPDAPVEWVLANVLHWQPSGRFDVWHDRAAFHFLTEASDQDAYLRGMDRALAPAATPSSERSRQMARARAAVCRSRAMMRPCFRNGWVAPIGSSDR